ncbi:MAG: AMP-binding protein, partial [Acidimicrobiia bacterium]
MSSPPTPSWSPDQATVENANVTEVARELGLASYQELHRWSVENRAAFWEMVLTRLGIVFDRPPDSILSRDSVPQETEWLPGALLNIVESCFQADPAAAAIHFEREGNRTALTYAELAQLVDRVAHGVGGAGFERGARIAIAMPMTVEAVAAYLGIIKAGCVVVSIADSFAAGEIRTRLELADA